MRSVKFILVIWAIAAWIVPHSLASGTIRFSKNGTWGIIKTEAYTARIRKAGSFVVDIKKTMELDASLIHCWTRNQHFPHVKYVEAKLKKNKKLNLITIEFKYFWNDGKVCETLNFTPRSIEAAYVYTPFVEKNTSFLKCVLGIRKPKKQPENLELVGLDRSIDANGALVKIGKWKAMRKPNFRMLSVRNTGKYVVDFLVEDNAWLSLWNWPRLGICDNGDYPQWTKTVYKAGEPKTLKYMIEISEKNGKCLNEANVSFKSFLKK